MHILRSGDINRIRTYEKRPDLLEKYELTNNDKEILETYKKQLKTISVMLT